MQPQNILANRKRPKTSCMIRNTYSLLVRGVGKSPIDDIFSPQKKDKKNYSNSNDNDYGKTYRLWSKPILTNTWR